MTKQINEAIEDIIRPLAYSERTNDYSYFILNPNNVRNNLILVRNWINEQKIEN